MSCGGGRSEVEAILFGAKEEARNFRKGQKVSLVYSIDKNEWNGRVLVQILIKDYKVIDG